VFTEHPGTSRSETRGCSANTPGVARTHYRSFTSDSPALLIPRHL